VDGVDLDVSHALTNNWNVSGGLSWADGRYSNALLPCLDGNFDGVADNIFPFAPFLFPPGVLIARCRTSGSSATTPRWNATLQSEYNHPITAHVDGVVGGVVTYYPSNPNSDPRYVVPSYALLNVYLGVRSPGSGWEVQAFAKNLGNNRTITALAQPMSQRPIVWRASSVLPVTGALLTCPVASSG
jgi:iron complex outermembrane receptor protein